MEIKLLGTGCASCKKLEKLTVEALSELNIYAEIEHVNDISEIMTYDVKTPALVIERKVVVSGMIPTLTELKEIIAANN